MIISSPCVAQVNSEDDLEIGAESVQTREMTVSAEQHGQRLDRVLAQWIEEFSRSYLQQLVADGALQINGRMVDKSSTKLSVGQSVALEMRATAQSQAFRPESMDLDVLFEDEHVLVINKPAGLVVHPAAGHWSGTLLNGLLARSSAHMQLPRAGIVHRLDKDTSGLMVVARSRQAMDRLVEQIAARQVSRHYLALAHRAWTGAEQRTCELAIGRDPRNRLRMAVVDLSLHSGKTARTHFTLLHSTDSSQESAFCAVHAQLDTGRTHQIRVHMSHLGHLGHPLVGDTLYGGSNALGLTRQALHAQTLLFDHPISGVALRFDAPMPPDLQLALDQLGWATMALI